MSKKILLFTRPITTPWDEGSKNLAWEIAKNSNDKDLNLSVLTPQKKLSFLNENKNVQPQKIYSSSEFNTIAKIKLLKYFFGLRKKDFDIIHFLFTPRSLTSSLINSKIKKLRCKTIQTIATLNQQDYEDATKLKKILFADKIIAQSSYTLKKLKTCGLENAKLIYPGINLNYYRPQEKNLELQNELGIEPNDFIMIFAGEFTRLDAIDDVVKAMHRLSSLSQTAKRQSNNFKLIIACRIKTQRDAIKKRKVEAKIKELDLEKNIIVLQKTVNLIDYYNLSDLSIFPAQKMAGKFDIPLVLIESMACAKPVLVSDLPILKEFIQDGQNGYVSTKANPQKLAEKIYGIMNNPKQLATISQKAFEFSKQSFDINKNICQYISTYKEL